MNIDTDTWGPQVSGWYTPTAEDIAGRIEQDLKIYVDPNLDTAADGMLGQEIGIYARQAALAWEGLSALNAAMSRSGAEGDMLTRLGEETGTPRLGPSTTKVTAQCALLTGTVLEAGVAFASISGKPDVLFTPLTTYTALADATVDVVFEALETGSVACAAGTLTVISTPTTGWTSITNGADGVLGDAGDTADDEAYRDRQIADLTRAGSSTAVALAVDLVYDSATGTGIPGCLAAVVLENETDFPDPTTGLPPHSIEPVLQLDGTELETDIAREIWTGKKAGTQTYGAATASFVDDLGVTRTIRYTEVVQKPVYIAYSLTPTTDYIGDAAVKTAVAAYFNEQAAVGVDVNYIRIWAYPLSLTGVLDATACNIGFSGPPAGTSNLTIGLREIATFDAANITVSS